MAEALPPPSPVPLAVLSQRDEEVGRDAAPDEVVEQCFRRWYGTILIKNILLFMAKCSLSYK
jgi:hypothetical protein